MGKLKNGIFFAALAIAASARAGVPNTFTSGSPASASQVNANFSSLDARVGALEGGDISGGAPLISITSNPQTLGTQVTVLGVTYTIIRLSVPGLAGDTTMAVTLPTAAGNTVQLSSRYFYNFHPASFTTTISGRTAECSEDDYYNFDGSSSQTYNSGMDCGIRLDAKTWLNVSYFSVQNSGAESGTSPDFSATNPFAVTPSASQRSSNRAALRALLGYIQITP